MGNHELYMRRRKPDSIEVKQMRQQAKDDKQAKLLARHDQEKELKARLAAKEQEAKDVREGKSGGLGVKHLTTVHNSIAEKGTRITRIGG